jgi:UTP-glucose-1-phosphate uridylyltransferase
MIAFSQQNHSKRNSYPSGKTVNQLVVEEAAVVSVTKIVLVTLSSKALIENHIDSHFELETQLQQKVKVMLLNAIRWLKQLLVMNQLQPYRLVYCSAYQMIRVGI